MDAEWITPKWGWKMWGLGVAMSTAVFAIEYSCRRIREFEAKLIKVTGKLEEIEKSKPRVELKEPGAIYCESVNQNFGGQHGDILYQQTVPFWKVRSVNDLETSYPSAKANGVRAKIDYYRCSDSARVLSIDGRWSESDQPSAISPLASKTHLLVATFGLGEERSVDIAYRDGRTGQYYAWNNDNYNYEFFLYSQRVLEGDRFQVKIRLWGDWIDATSSFVFRTENEGFVIEQS
jgi:hypothetical protein